MSAEGGLPEPGDDALRAALEAYRRDGFARLGKVGDDATVDALRERTAAIMRGEITYDGLFFQLDSETGRYEDLEYGKGWRGPSPRYRKIEKLEKDPLFLAWLTRDAFRDVARAVYGEGSVTVYRALVMNKHEGGGSDLPWHQDGGAFWGLDREPVLQIWTALDDAPEDGGCLEVLPGTHRGGLVTPLGGVVPSDRFDPELADRAAQKLPAKAGEVILLHNHLWHRSGVTRTGAPRRAFSVCYMDGRTRCLRKKRHPRAFFRAF